MSAIPGKTVQYIQQVRNSNWQSWLRTKGKWNGWRKMQRYLSIMALGMVAETRAMISTYTSRLLGHIQLDVLTSLKKILILYVRESLLILVN